MSAEWEILRTLVNATASARRRYTNRRGWHCLFHRSPFSNPDIAIGHAYSLDGLTWQTGACCLEGGGFAFLSLVSRTRPCTHSGRSCGQLDD